MTWQILTGAVLSFVFTVNASPKDLYKSWATKKGIEQWFLRLSEFKKPDGSLRAQMNM